MPLPSRTEQGRMVPPSFTLTPLLHFISELACPVELVSTICLLPAFLPLSSYHCLPSLSQFPLLPLFLLTIPCSTCRDSVTPDLPASLTSLCPGQKKSLELDRWLCSKPASVGLECSWIPLLSLLSSLSHFPIHPLLLLPLLCSTCRDFVTPDPPVSLTSLCPGQS